MAECSEKQRARRARRKIAGKCTRCGLRKPTEGYKTCHKCRQQELKWARKERRRRRATGLCWKCGTKPAAPDRNWCIPCFEQGQKYKKVLRDEVFAAYGGYRCACPGCDVTQPEFLQIDHIDGGGYEHRKKIGSGHALYHWLKKNNFPEGFRVLCANCNSARGFYGYCPHNKNDTEVVHVRRKGKCSSLSKREARQ